MYPTGIDISKFKHNYAIIDELGDTVTYFNRINQADWQRIQ